MSRLATMSTSKASRSENKTKLKSSEKNKTKRKSEKKTKSAGDKKREKENKDRQDAHKKTIEPARKANVAAGRRGRVRCAKQVHRRDPTPGIDKRWPLEEGYENWSVCSGSANGKMFSPMSRKDIPHQETVSDTDLKVMKPAKNLENLWQGSKVWSEDVNLDGSIRPSFYERRKRMFEKEKGQRHASPAKRVPKGANKNKPLFSLWQGRRMSYLEARVKIYCPKYAEFAQSLDKYKELEKKLDKGYNLQIIGYDGYATDDMKAAILDGSRPFGHELVLTCLLQGIRPWEDPAVIAEVERVTEREVTAARADDNMGSSPDTRSDGKSDDEAPYPNPETMIPEDQDEDQDMRHKRSLKRSQPEDDDDEPRPKRAKVDSDG